MVKDEKGWNKHLESFFTEGKVHQDSNHRVKSPMWKRMTARFGRCQEDLRWNTRPEDRTCQRKHQRWHCGLAWDRGGARTTHGALKNWSKLSKTFIHLSLDSFICCHCVLNLSGIAAWVFQILDLADWGSPICICIRGRGMKQMPFSSGSLAFAASLSFKASFGMWDYVRVVRHVRTFRNIPLLLRHLQILFTRHCFYDEMLNTIENTSLKRKIQHFGLDIYTQQSTTFKAFRLCQRQRLWSRFGFSSHSLWESSKPSWIKWKRWFEKRFSWFPKSKLHFVVTFSERRLCFFGPWPNTLSKDFRSYSPLADSPLERRIEKRFWTMEYLDARYQAKEFAERWNFVVCAAWPQKTKRRATCCRRWTTLRLNTTLPGAITDKWWRDGGLTGVIGKSLVPLGWYPCCLTLQGAFKREYTLQIPTI